MKNQNTEHWIQTVIFFRLNWHHRLLKGSPNNFAQAKIALVVPSVSNRARAFSTSHLRLTKNWSIKQSSKPTPIQSWCKEHLTATWLFSLSSMGNPLVWKKTGSKQEQRSSIFLLTWMIQNPALRALPKKLLCERNVLPHRALLKSCSLTRAHAAEEGLLPIAFWWEPSENGPLT